MRICISSTDLATTIRPLGRRAYGSIMSVSIRERIPKSPKEKTFCDITSNLHPQQNKMKVSTRGPTNIVKKIQKDSRDKGVNKPDKPASSKVSSPNFLYSGPKLDLHDSKLDRIRRMTTTRPKEYQS